MTQLFNSPALAIGTTPSTIWVATGKFQGSVKANITIYNNNPGTGPVTVEYIGQAGTRTETINPNIPYYAENVPFDAIQLSCTVSTVIQIDISTDMKLPANFQAISSTGVSTAPQAISTSITISANGTYSFFISPPTNKRWTLWGLAMKVLMTNPPAGGFTITGMSIHLITDQSAMNSEGPFWSSGSLSDGIADGQSDEFWVVPSGMTGVGSSATYAHSSEAVPFEIEIEQSMSVLVQVIVSGVTQTNYATLSILPLGIEEPA